MCSYAGGVRLRRKLAEERAQHHDRLHVVPLHLRRHRRPAVQRTLLLLQRRLQEHRGRVPVSNRTRSLHANLGPVCTSVLQNRSVIQSSPRQRVLHCCMRLCGMLQCSTPCLLYTSDAADE